MTNSNLEERDRKYPICRIILCSKMRRYYKTPQNKHRSNTAFINIYGKKKKNKQCSLQRIRKNSILTLLSQVLALQSKSLGENDLDNQPNVVLIFDNEEQKRLLKAGISWTFHTRSKIESRKLNYRNVYVCLCFCLYFPTILNSRIIVSKTNTMIEKE